MISNNRKKGKTFSMVMGIKQTIEKGGKDGVVGCKNPQQILNMLNSIGADAECEPMIATQPLKPVIENNGYDEFISGFSGGEKKITGYVFTLKKAVG